MRSRPALLTIWTVVIIVVLYVPILAMMVMSFNDSRFGTLPFEFTLKWYAELTPTNPLIQATYTSIQLSILVAGTCVVVGTLLSLWLARPGTPWLRNAVNSSLLATVTIPILILSVAILGIANRLGLGQSVTSLWLGCTVVSLPYVVFVVSARIASLDPALLNASRSLGFGPFQTFLRVTLPLIRSAVLAGALMAFVTCFNNFAVQLFLAPLGVQTLPVNIYAQTRVGISPDINAVSTLTILVLIILVVVLQILSGNAAKVVSGTGPSGTGKETR
ncbi:ABC transporter permease [Brevibacterium sp.]|uniref:ABC transporter permease n=1 Tax=Brevibacterium sp. TaxID=1701 RepID=UPI0028112D75|nr:ABC transporter permease [Brevibacterium sp.]